MPAKVVSVAINCDHTFSKQAVPAIEMVAGWGIRGDAHLGVKVQHQSRVKADPSQPNLRQVHLIHSELFDEVALKGYAIGPGDLGENITTTGIDLLGLPRGAILKMGADARVEVTGLRNPCAQIDAFMKGLLAGVLDKGPDGEVVRKAGIMSVVLSGGIVRPGDSIDVILPPRPWLPLERV